MTWVPCRHRPFSHGETRPCFPEAKGEVRWRRGGRRSVSVGRGVLGSRPLVQKRRGQKWLPGHQCPPRRSGPRLALASLARRTLHRERWVWDSPTSRSPAIALGKPRVMSQVVSRSRRQSQGDSSRALPPAAPGTPGGGLCVGTPCEQAGLASASV